MPPRPRRTASRSMGRARRRLAWAQSAGTLNMTANNQWFLIDLLQDYKASVGASAVGATVMRTHLWVLPHAVAAGDLWWIGLNVGDLNDVSGATTVDPAVPNPRDNHYLDWMLVRRNEHDIGLRVAGHVSQGLEVDLRSKRKMHQVQMAYILTIYQETVGTVAKSYDWFARTLIALP